MAELPPVPMRSKVVDRTTEWFTRDIVNFLNALRGVLATVAQVIRSVAVRDQDASIPTTDLSAGVLPSGLARVTYALQITQAATVSSSAQVTLGWTTSTVSASQTFAAVTGNTTATQQSGTITVLSDAGTPITYAVAYVSVGATPMVYSFDVRVEALP